MGSRGKNAYGAEFLNLKDRVCVTAIADIDEERRKIGGETHGVPEEMRFQSAEELFSRPKLADAVCVCTQDRQHVGHAVAALKKGYDVLLEKPVSPELSELQETIREALETGPYGRCAFFCDNDVVDNQIVNMQMENGAVLSLIMSAFTSIGGRTIKIMGTHGDLWGDMHQNIIRVCEFGKEPETIDLGKLAKDFAGHGGGDRGLVLSFLNYMEGKETDSTITTLETSEESHLVALAAEESRLKGGMPVEIAPMRG